MIKFFNRFISGIALLVLFCFCGLSGKAQDSLRLDSVQQVSIFRFDADTLGIGYLQADKSAFYRFKDLAVYEYMGDSLKTYYGVPVASVKAFYYQGRLYRLDLSFGKINKEYTSQEFDRVQNELEALYGKMRGRLLMTTARVLGGGRWEGQKMMIDHTRHAFAPKKKGDNGIYGQVTFSRLLGVEPMLPSNAIK